MSADGIIKEGYTTDICGPNIYISQDIKRPGTKVLTNAELRPEIHFHFIANLPAEGSPPLEYSRCAQAYLRSLIL